MAKDHGLYVTLLPKGKIRRDLARPAGKISLEETSIQDELILFSELSFEPYAMVVDAIRNMAADIMRQDREHYGEVDMVKYQLMVDTTIDLVVTLEGENPMQGTLLRTRIEDEIPQDDGSAMYPIRTGQTILSILTGIMGFQFVVNEVLHDLAEKRSLASEKYEGLWSLSVTEVLTVSDDISSRYHLRSAVDYYHFLLLHFAAAKTNVAFCQCCGRYFVPKTKSKTIYCDRILKDGKTCKHWGPILKHRLEAQDIVIETFDRVNRRMYKRYERTADGKQKPTGKDLSYEEYYVWHDRAIQARDDYLNEKIPVEDALAIIEAE
ncbi:MAG: DUF6076 domain-containing protein [Butyricicoccus sp.]|nr:DUF6076 domain-containing protein [Butyricicoccus sp.]